MSKELELLRSKLHAVDEQLIVLLSERSVISRKIGLQKRKEGQPIKQPKVWNAMRKTRSELAKHYGADQELVEAIFELIHHQSIKAQSYE